MLLLKQSTAAVIPFGPALDPTDGVTLKTGLVSALDHATTGIMLSKNGGAVTIRHQAVTATTYSAYGIYLVTLDTTDTATLGRLKAIFANNATVLPMWADFEVLAANIFDSLVGASTFLKTDIASVNTVTGNAALLAANVAGDIVGTVSTALSAGSSTSFSCADITEPTANHYFGKQVTVTSGTLLDQYWGTIQTSTFAAGETLFTVSPGSPTAETLANGATILIGS